MFMAANDADWDDWEALLAMAANKMIEEKDRNGGLK